MKRVGFIYEKVYDKNNIKLAIQNASKGKRRRRDVVWVLKQESQIIDNIHDMLKSESYIPSKYKESIIIDGASGKERVLHKPKFYPDQIIHWCLINIIKPQLKRGMYKWSCASISNRGQIYAKKRIEKWVRKDLRNTKHVFKLDIKKYYPSINYDKLKAKFRRIIKDNKALRLIDLIIDSHDKGIPIGNFTSQWFANFYLQDVDHFIKEDLGVKYYMRYMDDLVLFGSNKRKLRQKVELLKRKLQDESLEIKDNWQIFPFDKRRLDFVGFVFLRNKTLVRKRITKRMRRKFFKWQKKPNLKNTQSLLSYYGWLKYTNTTVLKHKYFKNINKMKEIISNYDKNICKRKTKQFFNQQIRTAFI